MAKYHTRAVEVDAFQWTGGLPEIRQGPEWIIKVWRSGLLQVRPKQINIFNSNTSQWRALLPHDILLHFPDGHIEGRTFEKFKAEFEAIPRPGCGSCGNDVTQVPDGADPNTPNPCTPCEDGSCWTPRRIPRVLDALRRAMERWPDLPLSQLLANVNSWASDDAIVQHFIKVSEGDGRVW